MDIVMHYLSVHTKAESDILYFDIQFILYRSHIYVCCV